MIKFDERPLDNAVRRISIRTPAGDCVLLFRRPTDVEIESDQWRAAQIRLSEDRGNAQAQLWAARRNSVVGWEGIIGASGKPLEFSQSALLSLILRVGEVETQLYTLLSGLYFVEPIMGEPAPSQDGSIAPAPPAPSAMSSSTSTGEPGEPGSQNTSE